ncbi:MAG: agmatine deiminase family protein [Bacteroidota bacterium]
MKKYIAFFALICTMRAFGQDYSVLKNKQQNSLQSHNIRIPAEWEEVQAVVVSWPFLSHTEKNDPKEVAEYYKKYAAVWVKLAAAVQEECALWIRVYKAEDTVSVKSLLKESGVALDHYKFIVYPGDNFWMRDYGPIGFYYGERDSIGLIDTRYRTPSANYYTDAFPAEISRIMNAKPFKTKLIYDGGNFKTDGFGNSFFTSRVFSNNTRQNIWSQAATLDTMHSVFNFRSATEVQALECDGGTGHIDMFFELLDEQTIALAEYPETVTAQDRAILERNKKILESQLSIYGTPYKIVRIPMPASDNGSFKNITCAELNRDPRTYMNGVFVNKSYILPIFSNNTSGNSQGDAEVVALFKKLLPGYKIVPVDSRILSASFGGLHCITMQIPAENPIHFRMKDFPLEKMPLAESYPVSVEISNKDKVKTAKLSTRKRGSDWASQFLMLNQRGSINPKLLAGEKIFRGEIEGSTLAVGDTVDYYISAESYNGKLMTKPITAPAGYYSFVITELGGEFGEYILNPSYKAMLALAFYGGSRNSLRE